MLRPQPSTPTHQKHKRLRIVLYVLLAVVALRIALPYVLLHFANERLAHMKGYNGHIDDIDLALYRGAYRIEQFHLEKVDSISHDETLFIGLSLVLRRTAATFHEGQG